MRFGVRQHARAEYVGLRANDLAEAHPKNRMSSTLRIRMEEAAASIVERDCKATSRRTVLSPTGVVILDSRF